LSGWVGGGLEELDWPGLRATLWTERTYQEIETAGGGSPPERNAMTEDRGFWSKRRREGRGDAELLVAARVHELRHVGYEELRRRADRDPDVEQISGLDGKRYRRRTRVKRSSDGDQEELGAARPRLVLRGGRLRRLNPLAEQLLIATPDGEMVGDYTLASEGNDPRPYQPPRRGA
jgi:hypothetical protein